MLRHHKDHVLMIISFIFLELDDNTNLVLTCVKYVLHKLCKKRSGVKTSEEAEQKKVSA